MKDIVLSALIWIPLMLVIIVLYGTISSIVNKIKYNKQQALKLTKAFGECKLTCACVEDIENGEKKLTFYLFEDGGDQDSTKKMERLECYNLYSYKRPKNAHKIYKNVRRFLDQMPYGHIDIDYTHKTTEEFLYNRELDKIRIKVESAKIEDQHEIEALKEYLPDVQLRIIRHIDKEDCFYYIMYVDFEIDHSIRYYLLFYYPKSQEEIGDMRAKNYISMLDKHIEIEESSVSYDDFYDKYGEKIKWSWTLINDIIEKRTEK